MSSMSGYVTYIEYQYGSNKGATAQGDLISNPFGFGKVDADYTGARVVEKAEGAEFTPAWGPVVKAEDGKQYVEVEGEAGVWNKVELTEGKATVTPGKRVRYV